MAANAIRRKKGVMEFALQYAACIQSRNRALEVAAASGRSPKSDNIKKPLGDKK